MTEVPPSLPDRARVLRGLLEAAGREALATFSPGGRVDRKGDGSPVTAADLAAERVLLDGIRREWPEDGAYSEEGGRLGGSGDAEWTVDPIDGTSSFVEGLAYWGPTVARIVTEGGRRRVECGAVYLPRVDEYYHVEGGAGWFGEERLPPLADRRVPEVVYLPSDFHRLAGLRFAGKARCLGGTAAHLALAARGSARGVIVGPGWAVWDAAAGLALIEAVGGRAIRLADGAPLDLFADAGTPFAAGLPPFVDELTFGRRVLPLSPGADR